MDDHDTKPGEEDLVHWKDPVGSLVGPLLRVSFLMGVQITSVLLL